MSFDPVNCQNEIVPASNGSNYTVQCSTAYIAFKGYDPQKSYGVTDTSTCIEACNQMICLAVTGNPQDLSCTYFMETNNITVSPVLSPNTVWSAWKSGGQYAIAAPVNNSNITITPSSTNSFDSTNNSTSSSTGAPGEVHTSKTSQVPIVKSGFSPGTVAGAAVGAAFGAAILAFIAAFFLFRRRRPRGEPIGASLRSDKGLPSHPWEVYLPQPADDGKLTNAISTLFAQINQHVENYYGHHFQREQFERSRGFLNTVDSGRLQKPLEQLMPEMRAPLPVIKHSFASVILEKMSPASSPDDTLLPVEYGRAPPRLGATYRSGGQGEAVNRAYDYWRVLTAYLMYPNLASSGARGDQLGSASPWIVDVLTTAFAPWAKSSKAGQDHLNSVLKAASDTGLLIASQSSSFAFEWNVLQKEDGTSVVVSPALIKTTDEHGETLSQPQVLVKPNVESIQ